MRIPNNATPSVKGDLKLGSYPSGLASLPEAIESLPRFGAQPVDIESSWYDLTMLSCLAMILRSSNRPESSVDLRFAEDSKYSFLWRSGFFNASQVGHQGSPFTVFPDIWKRRPNDDKRRANFTPLITFDVSHVDREKERTAGYSELAKDATYSLLAELEKTLVYDLIARTELIESREYLHVVLWELVQNVIDHAVGTHAIIAAQVLYKGDTRERPELEGLRAQHYLEEKYSALPARKEWLAGNRNADYLMLTCVDNGIGIPASIRRKKDCDETWTDSRLLRSAFQREFSDHDSFQHRYAIHGLHLIAQLILSYSGYLYVQSGGGALELAGSEPDPQFVPESLVLPGTAFQLLLPLSAGEPRPYHSVELGKEHLGHQPDVLYATEKLRECTFRLPPPMELQQMAVDQLVSAVASWTGPLYMDFTGMPRERQFTSLVLLCVRRKKTDFPVIVMNASEELFTAIRGLRRGRPKEDRDECVASLDLALATELTRGEVPARLPLVMAVTRLRASNQGAVSAGVPAAGIAVQWLGIADDGPEGLGASTTWLLDELFSSEGGVEQARLERTALDAGHPEHMVQSQLRNIQRVNPNLLSYDDETDEWSLSFTSSSLYFDSVWSLEKHFREAVKALAKFHAPNGTVFFLNWREEGKAYLRDYYQLWPIVRAPQTARIVAILLLRLAYSHPVVGPTLPRVVALISVTAPAGQVAREMARILRIPHWEVPSVYDLPSAEWPEDFRGKPVLVVDDLIDTGTSSRMLLDELKLHTDNDRSGRNARCVGVLSALESREGRREREGLGVPVISLLEVELGRPTSDQIADAREHNRILEVDPHTLEPRPQRRFARHHVARSRTNVNELSALASYGGLRSGHFVYGGHHYYHFFDIVALMEVREGFEELWGWFQESLTNWHSQVVAPVGGEQAPVAIIYPYYSPVAAFLHRIQPLVSESFAFSCTIHVACPYQRSKQRLGYHLDSLAPSDRFAVFIDDGIASGGTLSEVVDAFVSMHRLGAYSTPDGSQTKSRENEIHVSTRGSQDHRAAILALTVFDRIGMNPRKHLKSVEFYRGGIRFDFQPRYSLNLRSYYARDCPICRIESDLKSVFRTYEHVRRQLLPTLQAVRDLLSPTYLSPIATCAPQKDMQLFSSDDTVAIVNACDALFSDQAGSSEIKQSIENDTRKSMIARLEVLINVMMDPILYRAVHDDAFFMRIITECLWELGVTSEYRCYFLMHIPYIYSSRLAERILLEVIPLSLVSEARPVHMVSDDGPVEATPTLYFDSHPEVFSSIVASVWLLRQKVPFEIGWDSEWRNTLRKTPYGNQFTSATSLTKDDVARESAVLLLCNFVTSYMDHPESYKSRLEELRNLIDSGIREDAFPLHSMIYLMESVNVVREHYDLGDKILSRGITERVVEYHRDWLHGDTEAGACLRDLLAEHFVPEQSIDVSTIGRQLRNELLSQTTDLVRQAKEQFHEWLVEQCRIMPKEARGTEKSSAKEEGIASSLIAAINENNDIPNVRVFGSTEFIIRTLAHLLRNPYESGMGRGKAFDLVHPEISLSVSLGEHGGNPTVRFEVGSEETLSQEEVNRCFRAGGGLMAQRQVISKWGGQMGGYPASNGRVVFFMELESFDVERKEKA